MKPNRVLPTPDRTDRGVTSPSSHPEQAKRDAEVAQQHGRDMQRINKLSEEGQRK